MQHRPYAIRYNKRKSRYIFDKLDKVAGLANAQNYNPLYDCIFSLNQANHNIVTLDTPWIIGDMYVSKKDATSAATDPFDDNFIECQLTSTASPPDAPRRAEIFAKYVPLANVLDYACGKYIGDPLKIALPQFGTGASASASADADTPQRAQNKNHTAYTDNFFNYLSGLLYSKGFVHGIEYYGSFVGNKRNFKYNIDDVFDLLCDDKKFRKYNGTLYTMDEFEHLFHEQLVPIDDTVLTLEDIGAETIDCDSSGNRSTACIEEAVADVPQPALAHDHDTNVEETADDTLSEISSCSSNTDAAPSADDTATATATATDYDDFSTTEDIYITIPSFPVQMICMEAFDDTLESIVFDETLKCDTPHQQNQWFAMLMQIIMTLITYQSCFQFTHNDLHTHNVMFITTDLPYLYYTYAGKHYRVPTYGRIYKIIDFGRAIYTFNGQRFCSDAYAPEEEADTLYNTEPYYVADKPRIEPNPSFDLTRLATTFFDFVMTEADDHICNADTVKLCQNPLKRVITEWCLDDRGKNVLFKANGEERYPDFKLYKMIARTVHAHTPVAQLSRPEFAQFEIDDMEIKKIRARAAAKGRRKGGRPVANHPIMDLDRLIAEFVLPPQSPSENRDS